MTDLKNVSEERLEELRQKAKTYGRPHDLKAYAIAKRNKEREEAQETERERQEGFEEEVTREQLQKAFDQAKRNPSVANRVKAAVLKRRYQEQKQKETEGAET